MHVSFNSIKLLFNLYFLKNVVITKNYYFPVNIQEALQAKLFTNISKPYVIAICAIY